jgi:hypothetical protein
MNEDRMDLIMANTWGIPDWLEKEVRERDKNCVYCRVEFTPSKISKKQQLAGSI